MGCQSCGRDSHDVMSRCIYIYIEIYSTLLCDTNKQADILKFLPFPVLLRVGYVNCGRKTFYLLRKYNAYSGPINLVPLLGGKI